MMRSTPEMIGDGANGRVWWMTPRTSRGGHEEHISRIGAMYSEASRVGVPQGGDSVEMVRSEEIKRLLFTQSLRAHDY
jgi:hypothetical protein